MGECHVLVVFDSFEPILAPAAPEVIGRKGYTWFVDWWSLGVTAYELIFRKRPFDGKSAEKMKQSIMTDSVKFPDDANNLCSPAGIQALKSVRISFPHSNTQLIYDNSSSTETHVHD